MRDRAYVFTSKPDSRSTDGLSGQVDPVLEIRVEIASISGFVGAARVIVVIRISSLIVFEHLLEEFLSENRNVAHTQDSEVRFVWILANSWRN